MNWYKKKICNNIVIDSQLKIFLLSFVKNWAIIFFLLMKGFGKLQLIINTSSHFVILEVLILQAPQRWNREASLLFSYSALLFCSVAHTLPIFRKLLTPTEWNTLSTVIWKPSPNYLNTLTCTENFSTLL